MKPARHLAPPGLMLGRIGTTACLIAIGFLAIPVGAVRACRRQSSGLPARLDGASRRGRAPNSSSDGRRLRPDGRVFVCEDYMDMPGPVDRPVNRILCVHPEGMVLTVHGITRSSRRNFISANVITRNPPPLTGLIDSGAACHLFRRGVPCSSRRPTAGKGRFRMSRVCGSCASSRCFRLGPLNLHDIQSLAASVSSR